jgi:hypothetical protein
VRVGDWLRGARSASSPAEQSRRDRDSRAIPVVSARCNPGLSAGFFPAGFQQALARDRLGIEADVLPGGHLIALGYLLGA